MRSYLLAHLVTQLAYLYCLLVCLFWSGRLFNLFLFKWKLIGCCNSTVSWRSWGILITMWAMQAQCRPNLMKEGIPTTSQVSGEKVLLAFGLFPEVSGLCWNQRSLLAIYVTPATAARHDGGTAGDSLEREKPTAAAAERATNNWPPAARDSLRRVMGLTMYCRALNSAVLIVT